MRLEGFGGRKNGGIGMGFSILWGFWGNGDLVWSISLEGTSWVLSKAVFLGDLGMMVLVLGGAENCIVSYDIWI